MVDDSRGEAPAVSSGVEGLPWDRRAELGLGRAFRLTCKEVMLRPAATFGRMESHGLESGALLFAWLCACVRYLPSGALFFFIGLMSALDSPALSSVTIRSFSVVVGLEATVALVCLGVVLVLSPVATFVTAGMEHLLLRMVGIRSSFDKTLRGYILSQGVSLSGLWPWVSLPLVPLWSLGVRVVAYRKLYRSGWFRTTVSLLVLPLTLSGLALWGYLAVEEPAPREVEHECTGEADHIWH